MEITTSHEKQEPMLVSGEPIGVCPLGHDWHLWRPQPELVRNARISTAAVVWLELRGIVPVTVMGAAA